MHSKNIDSRSPLTVAHRRGQIMILTVLALGGTILGATTIAGLLMLYQLRQTTDMGNSAKAIFAADAGMEKAFYDLFCADDPQKQPCPMPDLSRFSNGSTVVVECYDENDELISAENGGCASSEVRKIKSIGHSGNAYRAFEAKF